MVEFFIRWLVYQQILILNWGESQLRLSGKSLLTGLLKHFCKFVSIL
jgi:hypothetical protein